MTTTPRTPGHFSAHVDGTAYTDRAAFEAAAIKAKLYNRGSDDAGEGRVIGRTKPFLLKRRPRSIALTKDEREGVLGVGRTVTLRVEVLGTVEEIPGQVWALAPENGVWVATGERFYWVHKPTRVVHRRPEHHRNFAPIGLVSS